MSARALRIAALLALAHAYGCAPAKPVAPPPAPAPMVLAGPSAPEWPRREVLDLALAAYTCGVQEGRFDRPMLTLIDYSLPSSQPRLWVIDLETMRIVFHELVAHGDQSGASALAVSFSNRIDSHQSSLGLFRTDEVYTGAYGYSLRLSGLEPGVNDNARQRAIVVHGSPYVSRAAVDAYGAVGTTWGCPGLSEDISAQVIDAISGGSAVFAYYPDSEWLSTSRYLHCGDALASAGG